MRLDDLAGRLTCTVPEAGRLLGIGRDAAYRAAQTGQIPTLQLGRRLVVPIARLLELLGNPGLIPAPTGEPRQAGAALENGYPDALQPISGTYRRPA